MASPLARGLFAKALSESAFSRLPVVPWIDAEKEGIEYAASFGITGKSSSALKELRALTAEQLSKPPAGWVIPVVDGKILPEGPISAFAEGLELKVPYIAGGNSWEASLIPTRNHLESAGSLRGALIEAYGGNADQSMQWDIATDAGVIEPNRLLARLHSNNGQKAWLYYDSYLPAALRGRLHGVPHGGEVMYVFGNMPEHELSWANNPFPSATPEDRTMSNAFIDYWVAYAKSSVPGGAGGPIWPRYEASTDTVLEFGNDGVHARPEFHKDRLDVVEQLADQRARRAVGDD
jgi:para-nitrobenzyl esterase